MRQVYSYLPALGKTGGHGTGKMQTPKKIGQRPCLESQRALLMLNGAKQKQVEGLPELRCVMIIYQLWFVLEDSSFSDTFL